MYYPELCKQLNKFIRGEVSLSTIQDCFSRYWDRVKNNGYSENEDIRAKVEIIQIALEAYSCGRYLEEDLWYTINQFVLDAERF